MESFDAMSNKILNGVVTQMPDLQVFDEQITHLYQVQDRIKLIRANSDIGWIKVNTSQLTKELEQIIKQWIDKFTNFLLDNTLSQLSNIQ